MKKSKIIKLFLLASLLSACDKEKKKVSAEKDRLHLRSDTAARYTTAHHSHYGGFLPYYYVFRPFGYYSYGNYYRGGYHSSYVHPSSNNRYSNSSSHSKTFSSKSSGSVSRGGFGGSSRGSSSRGGS